MKIALRSNMLLYLLQLLTSYYQFIFGFCLFRSRSLGTTAPGSTGCSDRICSKWSWRAASSAHLNRSYAGTAPCNRCKISWFSVAIFLCSLLLASSFSCFENFWFCETCGRCLLSILLICNINDGSCQENSILMIDLHNNIKLTFKFADIFCSSCRFSRSMMAYRCSYRKSIT